MTLAWYLFYGRQLGMSRAEILSCPIGEISDMIACLQISNGAKQKVYADIEELMDVR